MAQGLYIRLLGEAELVSAGRPLALPPSKKTRALLGYLALTGRPQRREKLCGLFWDVADDPRAALRWSLSKLREVVDSPGTTRLRADREQVQLDSSDLQVDALELRRLLSGDLDALPSATLEQALGYFRGELLEGLELSDFPAYHVWCLAEREELRRLHTKLLSTLLSRAGAQPERALPLARQLVDLDPLDGAARALFMELLHASGRAREAEAEARTSQRLLNDRAQRVASEAERESDVPGRDSQLELPQRSDRPQPLIGRSREFARLSSLVRDGGPLRVALIEAEAGVGKTRLLDTLTEQLPARTLMKGAGVELTPRAPYAPWLTLLRDAPCARTDGELTALYAVLAERERSDAAGAREQLFRGVASFLRRAGKDARLSLVLDDVHWLDEGSAELLAYVGEACAGQALSILLAARPGALQDNPHVLRALRTLRRKGVLEELTLAPFSAEETRQLLRSVNSSADADDVHRESAGNALFALELARAPGRREQGVPLSIARLVRDRLSALSPEVADVLRWASVLGQSFEIARLEPLLALDAESFVAALELLERHGFVQFQGAECSFTHAIVRAAVYDGLSSPRRQLMHGKVARLLYEQADPSGTLAGELSRHAVLAGDAALAVRACVKAGNRCLRLGANVDAQTLATRGLAYVEQLNEPERTTLEIELWQLTALARRPELSSALNERLSLLAARAQELGAIGHAAAAAYVGAMLRWEGGQPADAERFTREMERITRLGDPRQRLLGLGDAARCLTHLERDLASADAFALQAEQLALRCELEVASVLIARGTLQRYRGELEAAEQTLRRALELGRAETDRLSEIHALEELFEVQWMRADYAAAEREAERIGPVAQRTRPGSEAAFARAAIELARCAQHQDRAFTHLDEALLALEREDAKQRSGYLLVRAAELALARAELQRADGLAERAIEFASLLERPSDAALAWAVRAAVADAQGDHAARQQAFTALERAQAMPLSSRAQESTARALARFCPAPKEREHGARHRRTRIR